MGSRSPIGRGSGLVTENALAFPVHARGGGPIGRFAYLNLAGVTANPGRPDGWGPGEPLPLFSRAAVDGDTLVVVSDPVAMWLVAQAVDRTPGGRVVVVTRSHCEGLPFDFSSSTFWRNWGRVVLALDEDDNSCAMGELALRSADREVFAAAPPPRGRWSSFMSGGASGHELRALLDGARLSAAPTIAVDAAIRTEVGSFEAQPIDVMGAFAGGHFYYAVRAERRQADLRSGDAAVGTVQEYVTLVVRGDGELLGTEALPAPRGTPAHRRVLALTDGTRIAGVPATSFTSWSFPSIQRFVADRREGRPPHARALARIVADIEAYVRSVVWLPDADAYLIVALYVVVSHCYRVFDAVPLLLVQGEAGSGKSELGQVVADLSFNGMVVGATTAAAFVRLIDETRGLLVLDDLERVSGVVGGFGDVSQILKCSYKAATARKAVADGSGRVVVKDFYGPKVVTNTTGVADVLRSRMLRIATRVVPAAVETDLLGPDASRSVPLRDELHVWAMCNARAVSEMYRARLTAAPNRDRRAEIELPLRVLAELCGEGGAVASRLDCALARQAITERLDPDALLVGAVRAISDLGHGRRATLFQIELEMLLRSPGVDGLPAALASPESLGRALIRLGLRDPDSPATRHRLRGRVVRAVTLTAAAKAPNHAHSVTDSERPAADIQAPDVDPLLFCAAMQCASCRYRAVCPVA